MANINALQADVDTKLELARALHETGTHAALQAAANAVEGAKIALSTAITEGADPCPDCGAHPHGMIQSAVVKNKPMPIYEIGCLSCKDHRATGFAPQLAVADWNAGEWLPASAGPSVTKLADADEHA